MSNSIMGACFRIAAILAFVFSTVSPVFGANNQQFVSAIAKRYGLAAGNIGFEFVPTHAQASEQFAFAWNADKAFNPASTMKLVTSAVSLDRLGADYRFNTEFYVDNLPRQGLLAGNLYIRGLADPSMVSEQLWRAVMDVRNRGVSRITGDVVADLSFLAGSKMSQQFSANMASNHAQTSLALNYGHLQVWVLPTKQGVPAKIRVDPDLGDSVTVKSSVMTVAGKGGKADVRLQAEADRLIVHATGKIGQLAKPLQFYRPVPNPSHYFLAAFKQLFLQTGGVIEGGLRTGRLASGAQLFYKKESELFLSQVLVLLNKYSNNFIADQLVAAIGAGLRNGRGGTRQDPFVAGVDYLNQFVAGLGSTNHIIENGSGLSRSTRISPAALNKVLKWAVNQPRVFPELLTSMRLFGGSKKSKKRPGLSKISGFVRAKTGTLRNSVSLSGIAYPATNSNGTGLQSSLVFSIMVNQNGVQRGKISHLHAEIVERALQLWQQQISSAAK